MRVLLVDDGDDDALALALATGAVALDVDPPGFSYAGRPSVHLTTMEHAFLDLLVRRRGEVVSEDALRASSRYRNVGGNGIHVCVCRLRKKLAQAGIGNLISTAHGHGYMIAVTRSVPIRRSQEAACAGE